VGAFNILAFGPSGSGKTVYLAALHHLLTQDRLAPGLRFAAVRLQDEAWLGGLYNQVQDPGRDFPDSTRFPGQIREIQFRFSVVRTKRGASGGSVPQTVEYTALDLTYFDYPGEWLKELDQLAEAEREAFEKRLTEASAILGVIDGDKLLRCLRSGVFSDAFYEDHIRVVTTRTGSRPVRFVITKWDLLAGSYTLEQVWERLVEYRPFRDLIADQTGPRWPFGRPVGPVPLIPVSSTGDFAQRNAAGIIEKVPGRRPKPVDVEVPLVAVVRSICRHAYDHLMREASRRDSEYVASGRRALREGRVGGIEINAFIFKINLSHFIEALRLDMYQFLWSPAKELGRSALRQYHRMTAKGHSRVGSDAAALCYLEHSFQKRLDEFEARPEYRDFLRRASDGD